jgi:hypothetical protein
MKNAFRGFFFIPKLPKLRLCSQFGYTRPHRRNYRLHGTPAMPAGTRSSTCANCVHVLHARSNATANRIQFSFQYSKQENSRLRRPRQSASMRFRSFGGTDTVRGYTRSITCGACANANNARFHFHRIIIDAVDIGTSHSPNFR